MGGHDGQGQRPVQIDEDGAARFQPGQFQPLGVGHLQPLVDQQRIAVPAQADVVVGDLHRHEIAARVDHGGGQGGGPVAQAPVGLLHRDDLGAQMGHDLQRAFGAAAAVQTDALADIIAGDPQAGGGMGHVSPDGSEQRADDCQRVVPQSPPTRPSGNLFRRDLA